MRLLLANSGEQLARAQLNGVAMMRKHQKTQGFTLLEIMVVVAIAGVIVGISVPRMTEWRTKLEARASARAMADVLNAARGQAIRTSTQHVVYLRIPGLGTTDPNGVDLTDDAGNDVDVVTLRDADGDCLIDAGEIQTFLSFSRDIEFGLTNATVKVPNDTSTAVLTSGVTFANPASPAVAVRWLIFRPDGIPVAFSGDATGCATVGSTGSGAGAIYMTNGVDDFAPVLTALGGVRLHSFDKNTNGWTF